MTLAVALRKPQLGSGEWVALPTGHPVGGLCIMSDNPARARAFLDDAASREALLALVGHKVEAGLEELYGKPGTIHYRLHRKHVTREMIEHYLDNPARLAERLAEIL